MEASRHFAEAAAGCDWAGLERQGMKQIARENAALRKATDTGDYDTLAMTPEEAQAEYEESVGEMADYYLDPPFWGVCIVVQEAEG